MAVMREQARQNLGYRVQKIAHKLNIPQKTVEAVVKEYQDGLRATVLQGETTVIDSIVSIKINTTPEGSVLRSRLSPVLKRSFLLANPSASSEDCEKVEIPEEPQE